MDNELIEKLISSDEMIVKTIEENSQSLNILIDGFSSIMSMTTVDGDKLEKQMEEQGVKEAEIIKGTLTESINQSSNLSIEQVAEAETSISEGSILSDETINNLIDVISNMQTILGNLNTESISGASTQTEQISEINTGNLTQVIDDFKTLSNLNWCTDWLKCLEKIVEQADVVKEALNSIPADKKVSLGINEDDLQKVDQSIQKVKEDITTDINLSVAKTEMIEQASQTQTASELSSEFLNSFSNLNEKISSFSENIENNTISQESFINQINQFSETNSKTIENTITTLNDTTKTILEKPNKNETISESKIITETKPETLVEFGFEGMTSMPQIAQTPFFTESAQGGFQSPLIQVLPMPPTTKEIVKELKLEESSPISTNKAQTEIVNIPKPPTISPEMTFEGLFGQMPMPMPPLVPKVETGASMGSFGLPKPISIEDLLSFKNPIVETTNISTEINKEEIMPLDLEKLLNFETKIEPINTIKETNTNFVGLSEPIGFEQLSNMTPNIIPEQTQNMGFQIQKEPKPFDMGVNTFEGIPTTENQVNETTIQNIQNLPIPSFANFENMFQFKGTELPMSSIAPESTLEKPTNLSSSIEEIFIKNQELPQIDLGSSISKIQNEIPQAPSELAASTEVMMNEVNLEPLGSKLSSSISSLGENLKNTSTAQTASTTTQSGTDNSVMGEILNMLTKLDTTLQTLSSPQGKNMAIPSMGNSLSDAQARMIGRQIANELKDNFSRLYN